MHALCIRAFVHISFRSLASALYRELFDVHDVLRRSFLKPMSTILLLHFFNIIFNNNRNDTDFVSDVT